MTVTSHFKVPSKLIKQKSLPLVTQSISSAAAYLDMSQAEFQQRFILTGRVKPDRLHQVPVDRITRIAESLGLRWVTWEQFWDKPKRYPHVKLHPKVIPLHRR